MAASWPRAALRPACLLGAALVAGLPAGAEMLHEALGPFERAGLAAYEPADLAVLEEFGLEEAEQAEYRTEDGRRVLLRALQFYDDTGAVAAYAWLRPADGVAVERGERAVEKGELTVIQFANYVVSLDGDLPDEEDVELALAYLPRPKPTADPPVLQYVPGEILVAGSGRLILGPVSLQRLAPEIAPSTVGFHFSPEGYYGRFATDSGELEMIVWNYPSNPIARGQAAQFQQLDGWLAKQDGPLIALARGSEAPDAAQLLLARVRYRAEVTQHVDDKQRHDNIGTIVLDAFILCGILAVLMVVGGVLVAGTRRLAGRVAPESILASPQGPDMQRLGIDRPGMQERPPEL